VVAKALWFRPKKTVNLLNKKQTKVDKTQFQNSLLIMLLMMALLACGLDGTTEKGLPGTNNKELNNELSLDTFSKLPREINGCACYFSNDSIAFKKGLFIFVNDFNQASFVMINGNLKKFTHTGIDEMDGTHTITQYKNDSLLISLKVKGEWPSNYESILKTGAIELTQINGQTITKTFYGKCGCDLGENTNSWRIKDFWRGIDTTNLINCTVFNHYSQSVLYLPDRFYDMKNLKTIIMDTQTKLVFLSPKIKNFKKLETLIIQKSNIKSLPKEIGELRNLKTLTIAWGGQLTEIPKEIGQLENLEHLDLWRNNLTTLPIEIKKLKKLKTLLLGENLFSPAERDRIKKLLPNCKIQFDY